MEVVIFCGGMGTRLKEITKTIPKPLIEIGNKPVLWNIMKIYSHYGFNDFILCLGYKGDLIKKYFKKNNPEKWNIQFVDTGLDSTKAERLFKVKDFIKSDNFFVAYGDDLSDVNISKLLDYFNKKKKIALLTAIQPNSQYGILETNWRNIIKNFKEKPKLDVWINGGFFIFNKKIFNYIKDKDELEVEVFNKLLKHNQICAYKHKGFWKSMNTFKELQEINNLFNKNNTPWMVWK